MAGVLGPTQGKAENSRVYFSYKQFDILTENKADLKARKSKKFKGTQEDFNRSFDDCVAQQLPECSVPLQVTTVKNVVIISYFRCSQNTSAGLQKPAISINTVRLMMCSRKSQFRLKSRREIF